MFFTIAGIHTDTHRHTHTDMHAISLFHTHEPTVPGLPGPEKWKRPNLAISSFKKGQILKNEKKAK